MQVELKKPIEDTKSAVSTSVLSISALVETYQHLVFNTCFMFLKNREDAEDVAQEVFVEVYKSMDRFRGDSAVSTWIYRIAVNRSMDYIRMKSRKKRSFFAFTSFDNENLERLQIKDMSNPVTEIEEKEKRLLIEAAIEQLPERQRIAFVLAKVDGLKQEQVADIMETTVGSVESLLIRAKRRLKELLIDQLNELM